KDKFINVQFEYQQDFARGQHDVMKLDRFHLLYVMGSHGLQVLVGQRQGPVDLRDTWHDRGAIEMAFEHIEAGVDGKSQADLAGPSIKDSQHLWNVHQLVFPVVVKAANNWLLS